MAARGAAAGGVRRRARARALRVRLRGRGGDAAAARRRVVAVRVVAAVHLGAQAQVGELDVAARVQQQVVGLDVAGGRAGAGGGANVRWASRVLGREGRRRSPPVGSRRG